MTFYADLTNYSYSENEPPMVNVGWLSRDYPYATGEAPPGFVDALADLTHTAVNVQRGMHFCDLCSTFQEARLNTSFRGAFIGSGEIRILSQGGPIYVSPVMIVHYVADHGYLPPEVFVDAVLTAVGS